MDRSQDGIADLAESRGMRRELGRDREDIRIGGLRVVYVERDSHQFEKKPKSSDTPNIHLAQVIVRRLEPWMIMNSQKIRDRPRIGFS